MDSLRLKQLVAKYKEGDYTKAEAEELLRYFHDVDLRDTLAQLAAEGLFDGKQQDLLTQLEHERLNQLFRKISTKTDPNSFRANRFRWRARVARALIAAVFLSLLSIGYWYWRNMQEIPPQKETQNLIAEDLTPATNKAVIVLDDREEIALLENSDGIKAESGMITYANGDRIADIVEAKKITIKTPNAGFYKLTLPDQSVVWLNAASSIAYPSTFGTNAREISVTGEAYLQVHPLPNRPFIVQTEGQKIEVLGTSFNVTAYPKELTATTLVAGKVKITDIRSGTIHELLPNQHAVTNQAGTKIEQVDVSKLTAWKDGYFVFDSMELAGVMRQLSRWYDVEVDYTNLPNRTISARIKRDKNISAVLNAISKTTDLDFYINERRMMLKR